MTEQELRELDAWIAENIMGWRRITNAEFFKVDTTDPFYQEPRWLALTDGWHSKDSIERIADFDGECDCGQHSTGFSPTTDRAAAMEVLEKCLAKKLIGDTIISNDGDYWLRVSVGHGNAVEASAPNLPLAICLFAKKLFGKE